MKKEFIKAILSIVSFLAAIVIGFIALFIPPEGIIDSSILWFTAQLLVFTSGLLGVDFSVDSIRQIAHTRKEQKEKEKEKEESED